jgi:hypothetical protein
MLASLSDAQSSQSTKLESAALKELPESNQTYKQPFPDSESYIPTKKMQILNKLMLNAEIKKTQSNTETKNPATLILRSCLRKNKECNREVKNAYLMNRRRSNVNLELKLPETERQKSSEKKKNKRKSCLSFFGCFG